MIVTRHKRFIKNYKKRISSNKTLDKKFEERLKIFLTNPHNLQIKDHKLLNSKERLRSFSITGDIRVLYRTKGDVVEFYDIGTHNQVY